MKDLQAALKTWTLDTLFPRSCVGCGMADQAICDQCFAEIVRIEQQACFRCGKISELGRTCRTCRAHSHLFQVLAAAHYADGPLREALHTVKYHGRLDLTRPLVDLITGNQQIDCWLRAQDPQHTILVPVPLARRRLWKRGFNQSALLSQHLSNQYDLPMNTKLLQRRRNTATQVALHRAMRQQNVMDAFVSLRSETISRHTIILVDDIMTTGATLTACAEALHSAGARRICALALARAE